MYASIVTQSEDELSQLENPDLVVLSAYNKLSSTFAQLVEAAQLGSVVYNVLIRV